MDVIISEIISQWGPMGLMVGLIFYMVYTNYKTDKNHKDNNNKSDEVIKLIEEKIDNLCETIELVDNKVDLIQKELKQDIKNIDDKVDNLPARHIEEIKDHQESIKTIHQKQIEDLFRLGPQLHKIMQDYVEKTNSDHIFVGSFHNGNSSLSGIPYYKFDIIAERFCKDKVECDCEFAHMYKDSDILRYDTLPIMLTQQDILYFKVPESGEVTMSKYDDIIWRRMRGRGIRQISLKLLRDIKGKASGFVGCVKFNDDYMDYNQLKLCASELEAAYHKSESEEKMK